MEYDVKDADRLGDSRLDCRLFYKWQQDAE